MRCPPTGNTVAFPIEEVMKRLREESGKAFDPKVVDVLQNDIVTWNDAFIQVHEPERFHGKVERSDAPATDEQNAAPERQEANFLLDCAACQKLRICLLWLDLGASLSLPETLSVFQ
jgi:hypothetical protein